MKRLFIFRCDVAFLVLRAVCFLLRLPRMSIILGNSDWSGMYIQSDSRSWIIQCAERIVNQVVSTPRYRKDLTSEGLPH